MTLIKYTLILLLVSCQVDRDSHNNEEGIEECEVPKKEDNLFWHPCKCYMTGPTRPTHCPKIIPRKLKNDTSQN